MSNGVLSIVDRGSARRQLQLSIVTILGMAIGAFILGLATPVTHPQKVRIMDDGSAFSGRLAILSAK